MKITTNCIHCKKEFTRKIAQKRFEQYGKPKFCSMQCLRNHYLTTCAYCGKTFNCPPSVINQRKSRKVFCSKHCSIAACFCIRTCKQCGKVFRDQKWAKGRPFCSRQCYGHWLSQNNCGENHPRWKGGWTNHTGKKWREAVRLARKRDDDTCQMCKITCKELDKHMDVHHIIPFRLVQHHSLDNLVCLCPKCHTTLETETFIERNTKGQFTAYNIRKVSLTLSDGLLSASQT